MFALLTCWMRINRDQADWRLPLMVNLMNSFVEIFRVHQTMSQEKGEIKDVMTDDNVSY